jgi:sigma-B regulation protein RsbU (phosphoserine phosphatase)
MGVELGDDLITKPFEAREVLARVERQVTVSKVRMALRESETKFRSVMESAIDAIISADASGVIRSWNNASTALFGFTEDEAIGRPLELIIPERYRKLHQEGIQRVSSGGLSRVIGKTVEVAAVRKNGSEFPVELSLATWFLDKERYYTGIIRDISERKQAEQKFRSVTESAVLGYTSEEAIGQRLEIIIPQRFHEPHRKGMQRVTAGGESRAIGKTVELFARTKAGTEIPIELSLASWTVRDEIYYTGIIRDIRERKQAEEALRKSEEKYRRIVETAGEGFILLNEQMKIIDANTAFCQLLNYGINEIIGKTPVDFASPKYKERFLTHKADLIRKNYLRTESELVNNTGHRIPVLMHAGVLRNDVGDANGYMIFVTDITYQKKALALAGEVQKSLLPHHPPSVSGLDIAGRNISCEEIGGDYFDFIQPTGVAKQSLNVVVGDIAGHGLDAALLMTSARAFLRMRASQPGTISDILGAMNRHLCSDLEDTGHFMTLFFLTVDLEHKYIEWARAGHDPALFYDPERDDFEKLQGEGLALGVDKNADYPISSRTGLRPGQVIAVGTDGIWEARNRNQSMFGKRRFQDLIQRHHRLSADDILNAIFGALRNHTRGVHQDDDMTLVIIKVE